MNLFVFVASLLLLCSELCKFIVLRCVACIKLKHLAYLVLLGKCDRRTIVTIKKYKSIEEIKTNMHDVQCTMYDACCRYNIDEFPVLCIVYVWAYSCIRIELLWLLSDNQKQDSIPNCSYRPQVWPDDECQMANNICNQNYIFISIQFSIYNLLSTFNIPFSFIGLFFSLLTVR